MDNIYFDKHMIHIFSMIANYCSVKGFSEDWINHFWKNLSNNKQLYEEFLHFLDTGEVLGTFTTHGYSVLDAFIWQMQHYNLIHDQGKNDSSCDKDEMVIRAFDMILNLTLDPDQWLPIIERDGRIDKE